MRRSSLSTAIVAGLSNPADLTGCAGNHDDLGQVLIYPYYTVQPGPSIEPAHDDPVPVSRVVKVRFLDASEPKAEPSIYLDPFDVWTAGSHP